MSNEESSARTRKALKDAIYRLSADRTVDSLTITEIASVAGVSRMAFYRNYSTKEALLADYARSQLGKIADMLYEGKKSADKGGWVGSFFSCIRENARQMKTVIELSNHFLDYNEVSSILLQGDRGTGKYDVAAVTGAFHAILCEWLFGGMKESPEEMSVLCLRLLGESVTAFSK